MLLATNGIKSRIFRSLGSRQVTLRWDASRKTVTILSAATNEKPNEIIIDVPVSRIEYAYITNGNYMLKIDGVMYDMEIQHFKGQKGFFHDMLGQEVGGLFSVYADSKSDGIYFINLLRQELPPTALLIDTLSSRSHLRVAVFIAIAILVILAVIGVMGATQR